MVQRLGFLAFTQAARVRLPVWEELKIFFVLRHPFPLFFFSLVLDRMQNGKQNFRVKMPQLFPTLRICLKYPLLRKRRRQKNQITERKNYEHLQNTISNYFQWVKCCWEVKFRQVSFWCDVWLTVRRNKGNFTCSVRCELKRGYFVELVASQFTKI